MSPRPCPRPFLSPNSTFGLLSILAVLLIATFIGLFDPFGLTSVQAQTSAQPIRTSSFPADISPTEIRDNTGPTNQTLYVGYARPDQATTTWSVAGSTLTNIVDAVNTATATFASAHGLLPDYPLVVSGTVVDTDLNGTYRVLTVPSSTTLTFTTANVTDATYTTGLVATTTAPLTTAAVWSIKKNHYDSNNVLDSVMWAGGNSGRYAHIWANRAVVNGSTTITFK
jgi:hypothetical protein